MANDTVSTTPSSFLTLVEQGSTPATPAAGLLELFIKTSDHNLYTVNSSGTVTAVTNSVGGSLSDAEAHLGSPVTLGVSSMTDVLSLSLAAGTWLLIGKVTITTGSSADHVTAELWDGTSHLDSGQITTLTGWLVSIFLVYKVTPSGTTTYKIRATSINNTCTANEVLPFNGVGNNSTTLYALKYA